MILVSRPMLTNSRNPVSRDESIAGMIAAHPSDTLALASRALHLTYGQLNERSGALAQGLHLLGVGADMPVAV
jgi:non-ribosomal peptide synthetase component F